MVVLIQVATNKRKFEKEWKDNTRANKGNIYANHYSSTVELFTVGICKFMSHIYNALW